MLYPVWPSGIPHESEVDFWKGKPFKAPLSTDIDGGNTRNRRRPGDKVGRYGWGRHLEADEMELFAAFLEEIAGGTARFVMPVSLYGYAHENRVVQIVGDSLDLQSDGKTLTTFSLDVYPASMLP